MAKKFKVGIIVEGDGKGGVKAVKATRDELHKLAKQSKDTGRQAESLRKAYARGGQQAGRALKAAGVLGVGGAAALTVLVRRSFQVADSLGKIADTINTDTKALASLRHAADLTGLSAGEMDKSIERMVRQIGEARNGSKLASDAIGKLGLNLDEFSKLRADEQFALISEQIQGIENRTDQAAIATALFGRNGVRLLNTLDLGPEKLRAITAELDALNVALSREEVAAIEAANDAITRLKTVGEGLGNTIAVQLSPFIQAIATDLHAAALESNGFEKQVVSAMEGAAGAIGFVGDAVHGIDIGFKVMELGGVTAARGMARAFTTVGNFIESLINRATHKVNFLIDAANSALPASREIALVPEFDLSDGSLFGEIERFLNDAPAELNELAGELFDLLDEPMPSESVEQWFNRIRTAAESAQKSSKGFFDSSQGGAKGVATEAQKAVAEFEKQLDAMREQIVLIETGLSVEEAAAEARQRAAGATDEQRKAHKALTAELQGYTAAEEQAKTVADERLRIATQLREELERGAEEFTISVGLDLSDTAIADLADQFKGLDDLAFAFEGIGGAGEDAIGRIIDATKAFSAASKAEAGAAFGAYAKGTAAALGGVQQFVDSGSSGFKSLGLAITALNTISAIQAILNQGSGDPYTAFARMAAMAAAVASLGVQVASSFGGGGGAGGSAGALDVARGGGLNGQGTVLGDPGAESESLASSLDSLLDVAADELRLTTEMARSLQNIDNALRGVTSEFAQIARARGVQGVQIGGTVGATDVSVQTQSDLFDAIYQMVTGTTPEREVFDTTIGQGIQSVFDDMGDALVAGVEILGGDAQRALEAFASIELPDINVLEDEDLDEIITSLFSGLGDQAAGIGAGLIGQPLQEFQLFGEGLLETLTRVSSGFELASAVTDELGIAMVGLDQVSRGAEDIGAELIRLSVVSAEAGTGLAGLVENFVGSADEITEYTGQLFDLRGALSLVGLSAVDVSQDMVAAAGGLEALAEGLSTYRSEFFSQSEQLAFLATDFENAFNAIGLGAEVLPRTHDEFRSLMESVAALGDEAAIGALQQLAPLADRYYDALIEGVEAAAAAADHTALQIRLLNAQGDTEAARTLQRLREIEAAQDAKDAESEGYLRLIHAAEDATAAQRELADAEEAAAQRAVEFAQELQGVSRDLSRRITELRGGSLSGLSTQNVLADLEGATSLSGILGVFPALQAAMDAQLEEQISHIHQQRDAALDAHNAVTDSMRRNVAAQIDALNDQLRVAERLSGIAGDLRQFVTGLSFDQNLGPGTPKEQLEAAQREFFRLTNAARGGDVDAAGALRGQAGTVLQLARDVFASSSGFQTIFDTITGSLGATAGQIDVESPEIQAMNHQIALLEQIRDNQGSQTSTLTQSYSSDISALNASMADRLEGVAEVLQLIEQATLLEPADQGAALDILREALVAELRGGDASTVAGFTNLARTISEGDSGQIDRLLGLDQKVEQQLTEAQFQSSLLGSVDHAVAKLEGIRKSAGRLEVIAEALAHLVNIRQGVLDAGINIDLARANLNEQNRAAGIPAYAMGGDFEGGVRLVGERGPELELTGRSRIFSADQTARILSGSGGADVVNELRAMRAEMRALESHVAVRVVTQDGRLIREETIRDIRQRSRNGEIVVHADGVAA